MLNFYRCLDCLGIWTQEDTAHRSCPYCGARSLDVEWLGRAAPDGKIKQQTAHAPCDSRCTGAVGPTCDCPCGGRYHGTGWVVWVDRENGSVRMAEQAMRHAERFASQGREWRALCEAVRRVALSSGEAKAAILRARRYRTHARRVTMLQAWLRERGVEQAFPIDTSTAAC